MKNITGNLDGRRNVRGVNEKEAIDASRQPEKYQGNNKMDNFL